MSNSETASGKIDLTTFFLSIASAAYMGLGVGPRGDDEKSELNLELARQNIDLLELMSLKTKGNRTPDEERLLDGLLFELRLRYVEKSK